MVEVGTPMAFHQQVRLTHLPQLARFDDRANQSVRSSVLHHTSAVCRFNRPLYLWPDFANGAGPMPVSNSGWAGYWCAKSRPKNATNNAPRVLRRLQSLRRWSHGQQIKSFFPGSSRICCAHGAGPPWRVPVPVGCYRINCTRDRLCSPHPA